MDGNPQRDVTLILEAIGAGNGAAANELLPLVYNELRRLAESYMRSERQGHTLDATGLVHEAYARLVGTDGEGWENRRHFFNAAAMAMRRVLIDRGRARAAAKRSGGSARVALAEVDLPISEHVSLDRAEDLDKALNELASEEPRWAETLQYRLILGLSVKQTAETIGVSPATIKNDYRFALAWLRVRLDEDEEPGSSG